MTAAIRRAVGEVVADRTPSADGWGRIVEIRRSEGVWASGQVRPGTRKLFAVVEFQRPRHYPGTGRVMYGQNADGVYGPVMEPFRRTIAVRDLVGLDDPEADE